MRETSLDEFLGEGDEPGSSGAGADADADADAGAGSAPGETDAVEPAVPTYDWTPEGVSCEACGAVVERRWRDDDGLVCAGCKAW